MAKHSKIDVSDKALKQEIGMHNIVDKNGHAQVFDSIAKTEKINKKFEDIIIASVEGKSFTRPAKINIVCDSKNNVTIGVTNFINTEPVSLGMIDCEYESFRKEMLEFITLKDEEIKLKKKEPLTNGPSTN
jgi:hypothetical protein